MNSVFEARDKCEVLIENAFNILSKDFLTLLSSISKLNEEIQSNDSRLTQTTCTLEGEILDYDFFLQDNTNESLSFRKYLNTNFSLSVLRTLDLSKFANSKVIKNLADTFHQIFEYNKSFYGNSLNNSNIIAASSYKDSFDFIMNNYGSIEAPTSMLGSLIEMMKNQEELRFVYAKIDKSLVVIFDLILFILKNTIKKRISGRLYSDSVKKHKLVLEMKERIEKDSELLKESYASMSQFKIELRGLLEAKSTAKSNNTTQGYYDELAKKLVEKFNISKKYTVNYIKRNVADSDQIDLYALIRLKNRLRDCRQFLNEFISKANVSKLQDSVKDDYMIHDQKADACLNYLEKGLDTCTLLIKLEGKNLQSSLDASNKVLVVNSNENFSLSKPNPIAPKTGTAVVSQVNSASISNFGTIKLKLSCQKTFMSTYESSSVNTEGI